MLTDVCNLACPYCFANEFVNKDKNEISEEAFHKAVDFILGDGTHKTIGLIGGEPTIHSKFDIFIRKLINDERVNSIVIYTNGIRIDDYWDIITHPKVHLLINCNPPEDIGEKQFEKLSQNLDRLLIDKEFKSNVTLGINMYNPSFNYEYILNFLIKYKFDHVRVSITVPNLENTRNRDAHLYFQKIKQRMFDFFDVLLKNQIVPNFDCNKIPSCLIEEFELERFSQYLKDEMFAKKIRKSNIMNKKVQCMPVIDIRQDLTAVRCFGLSEVTKQNIADYKTISELESHYIRTIDAFSYNTTYSEKCIDCGLRDTMQCNGGCLAFKIDKIVKMNKYVDEEMRKNL